MRKFAVGYDDGAPFFRNGSTIPECASLAEVVAGMTNVSAKRRLRIMLGHGYGDLPYKRALDFVLDVSVLVKEHSGIMGRRHAGKGTVLASLKFATHGAQLQYLFNGSRCVP